MESGSLYYRPKISVVSQNSLYLLRYSEIDGKNPSYNAERLQKCSNFNILFYIDIPTIDYYNDELNDTKLSKFNRRFRLNLFKKLIWDSFVDNNQEFWSQLATVKHDLISCTLTINTSGSIRYVETIKFLIETLFKKIHDLSNVKLHINLNVSSLTLKWFNTFLNNNILESKIINFIHLGYHHYTSTHSLLDKKSLVESPFKDYFTKLNKKFLEHNSVNPQNIESIVIIVNSTGIKALLTILSDKPLTNFISQDSIDQIFDDSTMTLQENSPSPPPPPSPPQMIPTTPTSKTHKRSDSKESIKRESLSLMHFQNNILTSNKDKSVRVRSQSISTKPYHHTNKVILNSIPIRNSSSNTNLTIPSIKVSPSPKILNTQIDKKSPLEQNDSHNVTKIPKDITSDLEMNNNGDIVEDDEDEDDDEENDEDEEDGISFYVPSLLSRTASSQHVPDMANEKIQNGSSSNSSSSSTTMKKGRFRSLSLMDPAQKAPFNQNNLIPFGSIRDNISSRSFSNIYVHDGDFQNDTYPKPIKRKRKYTLNGNLNNIPNPPTGLIPPEFYSKMSSPSTSNNSSNASLVNMFTTPKGNNDNSNVSSSTVKLFEKSLINNSLDEIRKINNDNNSSNGTLGKSNVIFNNDSNPYKFPHRNAFALMFNKPQSNFLSMDEEDRLMMGEHSSPTPKYDEKTHFLPSKPQTTPITKVLSTDFDPELEHEQKRYSTPVQIDTTPGFLDLNLYGVDENDTDGTVTSSTNYLNEKHLGSQINTNQDSQRTEVTEEPKQNLSSKFKKILSFDLYGDNDKDGDKFWMLGHNS
ncbi:similar to Saccharomyces cerevisiae YDR186C Putative protein of unknown function [Maudiozyma barnettii]|uniref:Uncharacterized protein n=1 Tax=Maudiozyma barnettii TaxID=61262 RepID=A0A8H2VE77_9SACH|nr:Snd1p [Kazachstania barnettii]CAB4253932.1 similar to Saccharomyces cerevisiae YDR186C Putative protein of unknown function [Kazachstania barnettii]CAD1781682.1 similar to Saccharomyces cerevisiae YDR186C Putative protein of unknown function [Kazachstania barnettii]